MFTVIAQYCGLKNGGQFYILLFFFVFLRGDRLKRV